MRMSKNRLMEMIRQIIKEEKTAYQEFFEKALAKFGVKSPDELEGEKKEMFFNYVDKNWQGKTETD